MPIPYLRRLTTIERSVKANQHLACYLTFIAGATNGGGFLAVRQYTSHMSGIVTSMASSLAAGSLTLLASGAAAVGAFMFGAFATTLLIRWGRKRELRSSYAVPLVFEACLLVIFVAVGRVSGQARLLSTTLLLCFTMGIQNTTITKISGSAIRTTHLTGVITDIGISLGQMASRYEWMEVSKAKEVASLRFLGSLVLLFLAGGTVGALGFQHLDFFFALPLAAFLLLLAFVPIVDDLRPG